MLKWLQMHFGEIQKTYGKWSRRHPPYHMFLVFTGWKLPFAKYYRIEKCDNLSWSSYMTSVFGVLSSCSQQIYVFILLHHSWIITSLQTESINSYLWCEYLKTTYVKLLSYLLREMQQQGDWSRAAQSRWDYYNSLDPSHGNR